MQTKIILVGIIILLLLGGGFITVSFLYKQAIDERDQAISFNNARGDSLKHFVNKAGEASVRASVSDLSAANARKMADDERLSWIRKFEAVNKRLNNIEQATRTTAVATANFRIPLRDTIIWKKFNLNKDSTQVLARSFDNHIEWFRIRGFVLSDTVVTDPYVPIELQTVFLWERKRKILGIRFGRKQWFSESASTNPYVEIKKHEVIRIGRKK